MSHTSINPADLSSREAYRLMLSSIIPRPIAWVSTLGADGSRNIAPFSFFNGAAGNPPTILFSVSPRRGVIKDTLRNVRETGEFVVNMVDDALAEAMNITSGEWDYEIDEFELAKITTTPSSIVKPPRVTDAPVAMEATVSQIIPIEGSESVLVLGRIVMFHIRERLLRDDGTIDGAAMRPIARLGGREYSRQGEVFSMDRPKA